VYYFVAYDKDCTFEDSVFPSSFSVWDTCFSWTPFHILGWNLCTLLKIYKIKREIDNSFLILLRFLGGLKIINLGFCFEDIVVWFRSFRHLTDFLNFCAGNQRPHFLCWLSSQHTASTHDRILTAEVFVTPPFSTGTLWARWTNFIRKLSYHVSTTKQHKSGNANGIPH